MLRDVLSLSAFSIFYIYQGSASHRRKRGGAPTHYSIPSAEYRCDFCFTALDARARELRIKPADFVNYLRAMCGAWLGIHKDITQLVLAQRAVV